MSENKSETGKNFLVQGSILAIAGVITKIIGAVYRIPLVNILGDKGMGYYGVAFQIYAIALTLTSYSLPLAVSKLVSARLATGQYKNAYRVFRGAMTFAIAAGGIVGELSYSDLAAFDIGSNGNITVTYNNQLKVIGRIEVTVFDNPEGLVEAGETSYSETSASGAGKVKMPGDQGAGSLATNKLEMSNVNLAQEFSDMIVTQRGFQANARIITTSDSMLEELVNLKR